MLTEFYSHVFWHLPLNSKQEGEVGYVVRGSWGEDHSFFLCSSLYVSFPLTQIY